MLLSIALAVFAAVFCAIVALYFLFQGRWDWRTRATQQRLVDLARLGAEAPDDLSILRREERLSNIPQVERLLKRFSLGEHLKCLIAQAGARTTPGVVVLAICSVGALTLLVVQTVTHSLLFGLLAAPGPALLPYLHLQYKRSRRLRQFEEQLPEALDMIVNALRSGFTLEPALKMVAEEQCDPLAHEFGVVFEQQNLGVPLSEALAGLRYRVPNEDLDILIISLVLNRRTGGNLAEVLEKAASTIRDRFRIKREVRTKTAHGRFSGFVLIMMPLGMAGILALLAPDYIPSMLKDPMGQGLLGMAVAMQLLGILVIRKIIDIKV